MTSVNWLYQQEPGPWTGGRSIYAPRGKTLGGSSARSTATSTTAASARISTPGRSSAIAAGAMPDVLPYFKRLERRVGEGDETFRGRDGSLTVTDHGLAAIRCARPSSKAPSASAFRATPTTTARSRRASSYCPAHHPERPARERGARRSCIRRMKRPNVACAHACACHQHHLRGQARGRRALPQGRHAAARRSRCAPARK